MENKLLYYKGGGYSGCHWEWNFCFWDADGIWHDLYSSGCDGADTEAKAKEIIENADPASQTIVDLTSVEDFRRFQKDNNALRVLQIAQELNESYNYEIKVTCCECGCDFIADRSEGDIAIDDCDIICYKCSASGTCDCCDEYVGSDNINYCNEDGDDDVGASLANEGYHAVCNDCFEYNKEQLRFDRLKDLFHQSLCTGKPDMFNDCFWELWKC